MKLSVFERTVLANVFRMREKLENDADWGAAADVFERGYEAEYDQYMVDHDTLSEEQSGTVAEILRMFRVLHNHKSEVKFAGFDGNDPTEGRYIGYVRYLWKQDAYTESKDAGHDGGNSHMPMMATYLRMLAAYRKNPDDIKPIEAAWVHPDNR